ncbi:MAG: hypothetical protein IJ437_04455 [Clostridia bacterium]|nr:hypothetical protein [Clostridia bacterium]
MTKKTKKVLTIIGCVLLCALFLGVGVYAVDALTEWDIKTVNENNIIKVDDYVLEDTKDKDAAIQVDVTEAGEIKVIGENNTDSATEIEVVSVILDKGEYYISSGDKKCDKDTYYLVLKNDAGDEIIADNDFTVTESTSYTLYIVIQADVEIDTTFSPVLVEGDEAESFFKINLFNN